MWAGDHTDQTKLYSTTTGVWIGNDRAAVLSITSQCTSKCVWSFYLNVKWLQYVAFKRSKRSSKNEVQCVYPSVLREKIFCLLAALQEVRIFWTVNLWWVTFWWVTYTREAWIHGSCLMNHSHAASGGALKIDGQVNRAMCNRLCTDIKLCKQRLLIVEKEIQL